MDAILDKFGKSVTTYNYDEDHFCAMVDVSVSNVFFSWIFGFGGKVMITSPVDTRDQDQHLVLETAKNICPDACEKKESANTEL